MTFATALLRWYDGAARDLPWRRPDADPWAVLTSEVMLQQTPVARVLPVYAAWLRRWPTPAALAADSRGAAVRMWGRLGYPRRALRLHAAALAIVDRHGGHVPAEVSALLALPGVGGYTARAVAAFGFGQREPVVDTNVRRVVGRVVTGVARAGVAVAGARARVEPRLPADPPAAVRMSGALMELGALVCTARSPRCTACPVTAWCAWRLAGYPASTRPSGAPQGYAGTDRQVRGLLLDVLRATDDPVPPAVLDAVWSDEEQRGRALATLVTDGLICPLADGTFALPS